MEELRRRWEREKEMENNKYLTMFYHSLKLEA
jgi:hypothetical protein